MPFLTSIGFDIQNPRGQPGYDVVHLSTPSSLAVDSADGGSGQKQQLMQVLRSSPKFDEMSQSIRLSAVVPTLTAAGIQLPAGVKASVFLRDAGFLMQNPSGKLGNEIIDLSTSLSSTVTSAGGAAAISDDFRHLQAAAIAELECDESTVLSGGASAAEPTVIEHEDDEIIEPIPSIEFVQYALQEFVVSAQLLDSINYCTRIKFMSLFGEYLIVLLETGKYSFGDMLKVEDQRYITLEVTAFIQENFMFSPADLIQLILETLRDLKVTIKNQERKIVLTKPFNTAMAEFASAPLDRLMFGFSILDIAKELAKRQQFRSHMVGRFVFSFLIPDADEHIFDRMIQMLAASFGVLKEARASISESGFLFPMEINPDVEEMLTEFQGKFSSSDIIDPKWVNMFEGLSLTHPSIACKHYAAKNCKKGESCTFSHCFIDAPPSSGGGAAAAPATPPVRIMLPLEEVAHGVLCKHYVNKGECLYRGCVFDHRLPHGHASSETPDCTSCANPRCCGPHNPECPNVPAPKQQKQQQKRK